ncbi:hypothetical protein C8R45DRAFT_349579 [Mycena sanguinolenta]|nr:hypothetical protein C8R45DRAFT_349579 [Mycena sanguinolenta]
MEPLRRLRNARKDRGGGEFNSPPPVHPRSCTTTISHIYRRGSGMPKQQMGAPESANRQKAVYSAMDISSRSSPAPFPDLTQVSHCSTRASAVRWRGASNASDSAPVFGPGQGGEGSTTWCSIPRRSQTWCFVPGFFLSAEEQQRGGKHVHTDGEPSSRSWLAKCSWCAFLVHR